MISVEAVVVHWVPSERANTKDWGCQMPTENGYSDDSRSIQAHSKEMIWCVCVCFPGLSNRICLTWNDTSSCGIIQFLNPPSVILRVLAEVLQASSMHPASWVPFPHFSSWQRRIYTVQFLTDVSLMHSWMCAMHSSPVKVLDFQNVKGYNWERWRGGEQSSQWKYILPNCKIHHLAGCHQWTYTGSEAG